MRIIVTENGKEIEKELEVEMDEKNRTAFSCIPRRRKNLFIKPKVEIHRDYKINTNTMRSTITNFNQGKKLSKTATNFRRGDEEEPRKITLSKNAVKISKALLALYDNAMTDSNYSNDEKENEHIVAFDEGLPEISLNGTKKSKNEKVTFEEIIGKGKVMDLKKKLVASKMMRDKLSKVDENCFRTSYQRFTDLEKLESTLKCKAITPNYTNLIRYISNEKDSLSKESINRIVRFDNEKMYKINRICQTVFVKQQEDKLKNEALQTYLDYRHNKSKLDVDNHLKKTGNKFEECKLLLDKYENKVNDRARYRDIHRDIKKHYWSKFDYEKLCGKKYFVTKKKNTKYYED